MKKNLKKALAYRCLIERFLSGNIQIKKFEEIFCDFFRNEPENFDREMFSVVNDLFEDLDAYSPIWKPEDESPFRLTETSFRKEAEKAAKELDVYIEKFL